MIEYVVGFLFNASRDRVALIEKQRPSWQRGRLNGIGGHIEDGETPREAMEREFQEETGYKTIHNWRSFCILHNNQFRVHFFEATGQIAELMDAPSPTDEQVTICWVSRLPINVILNLRWLIPLASDSVFADVQDANLPGDGE